MSRSDLHRMLDTATAFFLAAERCVPELEFGNYKLHSVNAPVIVNYSFSVELALKIIGELTGQGKLRGHSLSELFGSLPQDTKDRLPYLANCVADIDEYFTHWRYPYESDFLVGDYDSPRRAFVECYQEIRFLCCDLMSCYEKNWGSFEPDWNWAWEEKELENLTRVRPNE